MTAVAHAAPGPADPDTVSRTPDDPDLQLARDPRAGAGRLMVLAGNRPDLRGVIADNPGCSPELRAWVSRMGGASAGSGGGGHGGHGGPEVGAARTDGSGGVNDADDAVSLAPTGWEPSDIGLGDEPFGSVLGDPLMGPLLFDDDGPGHEPTDAEPAGAAARSGTGGRPPSSSRSTARPRTAPARTASARTASRTAAARGSQAPAPPPPPQRPAVTRPAPPAPAPLGRFAPTAPYPVPGFAGPVGTAAGAPGRGEVDPWAVGGAPAGGLPSAPPPPSGAPGIPGASFGMGRYNAPASSRSARRTAPSSPSSTSPAKILGWILFVLLFIVIRALNG